MKQYEVTWAETKTTKMRASVVARSRYEAIEVCMDGRADNEEPTEKGYIEKTCEWHAQEI